MTSPRAATASVAVLLGSCFFNSSGIGPGATTGTPPSGATHAESTAEAPSSSTSNTSSSSSSSFSSSSGADTSACHSEGEFGPMHTFAGLTSSIFVTQGCCSAACAARGCDPCEQEDVDDVDGNALYFCSHFYGPNCTPQQGYHTGMEQSFDVPKMHIGATCINDGVDIPGTDCLGAPCKIGIFQYEVSGVVDLICSCSPCESTIAS